MVTHDLVQTDLWASSAAASATDIQIRSSRRARRLGMRVSRTGRIEVVAPVRTPRVLIDAFISQHRDWAIERSTQALAVAPPPEAFPPVAIAFHLDGSRWRVHLAGGSGEAALREPTPGVLQLSGTLDATATRAVLRRWLLRRARPVFEPLLQATAAEWSIDYRSMTVRCQRSRWGSCSSRGVINLNASLLFQRAAVVRYLMIHELTHFEHMNHSARFWRTVEARCPDWRKVDRKLLQGWRSVPQWIYSK